MALTGVAAAGTEPRATDPGRCGRRQLRHTHTICICEWLPLCGWLVNGCSGVAGWPVAALVWLAGQWLPWCGWLASGCPGVAGWPSSPYTQTFVARPTSSPCTPRMNVWCPTNCPNIYCWEVAANTFHALAFLSKQVFKILIVCQFLPNIRNLSVCNRYGSLNAVLSHLFPQTRHLDLLSTGVTCWDYRRAEITSNLT